MDLVYRYPELMLLWIHADRRCIMIEGMVIYLGFYLAMVKVLKMTRDIEKRSLN